MINKINNIVDKYSNKNVVFSSCGKNWLLVLSSDNVNHHKINPYSYNITDDLYVHDIINKSDPSVTKKSIKTTFKNLDKQNDTYDITFEKDKIIDEYFYFISPRAAFFYELPDEYSGKYIKWNMTGQKLCEGIYVNGLKNSEWKYYDDNNNVSHTINYTFNKKKSISNYREDKSKCSEYYYDNTENCTSWIEWDIYGRVIVEGKLKNNDIHYVSSKYFESGKIHSICKYINKKLSRKIIFNETGNVVAINNYNANNIYTSDEFLSYYMMD